LSNVFNHVKKEIQKPH